MLGMINLTWNGDTLHRKGSTRALTTIEPDRTYPDMWRVRRRDGSLSDMVNRTRAKDAAALRVLSILNHRETRPQGGSIRQKRRAAMPLAEAA
jgi:hypothetical protein